MAGILGHRGMLLSTVVIPPTYAQAVAVDAPVLWYRMDETSGTAATDSGSAGSTGTYTGTFTVNQGALADGGGSVAFAGDVSGGRLDTNHATNYTSACTMECWFIAGSGNQGDANGGSLWNKCSYFAATQTAFPIRVTYQDDNKLRLLLSNGGDFSIDTTLAIPSALTPGNLYHCAVVYRANGQCEIWVNGVMEASTTIAYTISTTTEEWNVGGARPNGTSAADSTFKGRIGDAALYSYALAGARIEAHYAAGL